MSQTILGIDIAFQALKLASLVKQGKRYRLVGISYAPIPKDSWQADGLKNQEEIVKVLHDSMRAAKPSAINSKVAMIALPESVTYSITLAMPKLTKTELDQALPFEVAEKLSINLDEYLIDYEVSSNLSRLDSATQSQGMPPVKESEQEAKETEKTPEHPEEGADKAPASNPGSNQPQVAVFAVAVKKTLIQSILDFCELAHLELAGVDIKAGCILRSLVVSNDGKTRLIVDLGANTSGINVAEGQSPRLISTVPLGTNSYPGTGDAVQFEKFRSQASSIFDEIVHVTKFYQNRVSPGKKIESVILTGGGSEITGISELFTQETGLTTTVANPFALVDTHHFPIPHELAHKYADSIGLAMRPIHD